MPAPMAPQASAELRAPLLADLGDEDAKRRFVGDRLRLVGRRGMAAADGGAAEAEGGGFAGFLRAVGVGDAAAESKGCGNSGDDERVKQFHVSSFLKSVM